MKKTPRQLLAAACLLALTAPAAMADTATDAPLQLEWNLRARHESVDNDAFNRDARADTLRLRLGLRAHFGSGWQALVEGNGVASAGDHYNSGANDQIQYPGIADPQAAELNQAWLGWQGGGFDAKAGRQALAWDNQRWVSDGAFRQHGQTFDAVAMAWQPATNWTLRYAWLDRVHRSATDKALSPLSRERKLDTHLFNAAFQHGRQQWVGYAYLYEDRDVATASVATWGARWQGRPAGDGFGWQLELAQQSDYANNPQHFTHRYWLLEPAWTQAGITGKLGWEHLGGDGHTALQTPLGSWHSFDGWNDQFSATPAAGLNDRYASLNGHLGNRGVAAKLAWTLSWHDFRPDTGRRYGSEWDGMLAYPLLPGLNAQFVLTHYRADHFGHDDTKLWLQLEWTGKRALL